MLAGLVAFGVSANFEGDPANGSVQFAALERNILSPEARVRRGAAPRSLQVFCPSRLFGILRPRSQADNLKTLVPA